tara:strand:- start:3036 stop:3755 length:720 start_codon:yes stop_codon:yes gene_type:complete
MNHLEVQKEKDVCWVYLNRPNSMNALNSEMLKELTYFNNSLNEDFETKVVIYTGKGKNFSAGADIKEQIKSASSLQKWRSNVGKPAILSFINTNQITIAAINGFCLGGAACIASACDFRIASNTAFLGYPEINLGMNLNWFGLPLALRLIGPAKAKKMVISGENENSNTLYNWGFYDEVCEEKHLLNSAKRMAELYASKSALPAQMIKKSINELVYGHDLSTMHMDYDQFLLSRLSLDE